MGLRKIRFGLDRAAIRGDGFVKLASAPEGIAQIVVGFGKVRLELDRAAIGSNGFVELAALPQGVAQIGVALGKIRSGLERAPIHADRLVKMALRDQGIAETEVVLQNLRIHLDRPANALRRDVVAADLVSDETEVVQRIGMIWLRRKDLAVKRLGIRQAPALVMPKREFESLGNGHIAD